MNDKKIPGKRRRRCDICKYLKYGIEYTINPYESDINNTNIKERICPECYKNLQKDI